MGTPNDVVSVDRLVRVIVSTMKNANNFKENWPDNCLIMLESIARELRPLLKTFGRPLGKELGIEMWELVSGIVLKEWAFQPDKPRYIVCFGNFGWVLVRKPENQVYIGYPTMLANAIGNDVGGMQLFIDACAFRVSGLFRERRERLDELEQNCLLERMYEAFDRSKWPDTLKFFSNLG